MDQHQNSESGYYKNQPGFAGLVSKVSMAARRRMFVQLMKQTKPTRSTSVLDVGVTSNRRQESNFFEKMYPYPERVTAVGIEDAYFLEQEHPGLTYIKADALDLPFQDKSFDLVVSFAVIEHAGDRSKQGAFVRELCRVGKAVYITTPNRWFPIEFHTVTPFIHWLPANIFRRILRLLGMNFYAQEENLNLLTARDLQDLVPPSHSTLSLHHRLLGLVSNLVFYLEYNRGKAIETITRVDRD